MVINCIICNKETNKRPVHIRKGMGKYCSSKCYGVALSKKVPWNKGLKLPQITGSNHPNFVPRIKVSCLHCKKMFETREKWGKKFCNKDCQNIHFGLNHLGENNPAWNGGKTPLQRAVRVLDRYKKWRATILKRDNYACRLCYAQSVKFEVDHIIPFALLLNTYKINSTADALVCNELWDLTNGRTLCKECHLKTNTWGGGGRVNKNLILQTYGG